VREFLLPNGLTGDIVHGVACPKCGTGRVAYNGNYFCDTCPWVMPETGSRHDDNIVAAYLAQRTTTPGAGTGSPTGNNNQHTHKENQ
jgi:hypothetical protein